MKSLLKSSSWEEPQSADLRLKSTDGEFSQTMVIVLSCINA